MLFSYIGCVSNQTAEQTSVSLDVETTVTFVPGTKVFDAVKLFEQAEIVPDMTVRVFYQDHESEIEVVGLSAEEATNDVLAKEEELLSFLVTQFDPDNHREGRVHDSPRLILIAFVKAVGSKYGG